MKAAISSRCPDESGEGPRLVTVDFLPDSEEYTKENMMALGVVANGRSYFLLTDSIYDEPVLFNKTFPAFSYHWQKEGRKGLLRFLRIDFSDDDFINYEGEDLPRAMTMGDDNLFKTLPGALAGLPDILGMPIPHEIDFEKHAGEIAGLALINIFSQACRRLFMKE